MRAAPRYRSPGRQVRYPWPMDSSIPQLIPAFLHEKANSAPLVLATIVSTRGSTYRKAGAQILISAAGEPVGLLSGGCLESDLV